MGCCVSVYSLLVIEAWCGIHMHHCVLQCVRGADKLIRSRSVVAKAAQDSSESSGSIVKYVTSSVSFLSL